MVLAFEKRVGLKVLGELSLFPDYGDVLSSTKLKNEEEEEDDG